MIEFLILWASMLACFWAGAVWAWYVVRALQTRKPKPQPKPFPDNIPVEFKQWLHDYIVVNTPRRD